MFSNLNGALMVMAEPRDEMSVIAWFGESQLLFIDEEVDVIRVKGYDTPIRDADDAYAKAEAWFDEMAEEEDEDYE